MLQESAWLKTDIPEQNLSLLLEKEAGFAERRTLEHRELARDAALAVLSLISDGLSADEAIRVALVGDGEALSCTADIHNDNVPYVDHYLSGISSSDKAVFAAILTDEMRKCGIELVVEENRITVPGGSLCEPKEVICGHHDHRIVMAMSLLLSRLGGVLEGAEAVSKSYPAYFETIRKLGIVVIEEY